MATLKSITKGTRTIVISLKQDFRQPAGRQLAVECGSELSHFTSFRDALKRCRKHHKQHAAAVQRDEAMIIFSVSLIGCRLDKSEEAFATGK